MLPIKLRACLVGAGALALGTFVISQQMPVCTKLGDHPVVASTARDNALVDDNSV